MIPAAAQLPVLAQGCLHLFLLGPGLGESLVCRTPGGHWLVVDSYQNTEGVLPAIVLKHYQVTSLEALVLTHPHRDHFRGMVELCDDYEPSIVAAPASLLPPQWTGHTLTPDLIPSAAQRALLERGASAVLQRFTDRAEQGHQIVPLRDGVDLYHEGDLAIRCLAPDRAGLAKIVGGDGEANQLSAVLVISWGEGQHLLPADLPADEFTRLEPQRLRHNALKLPHHGSIGSWSLAWGQQGVPPVYWIGSPFNRGLNPPPQPEALRAFLQVQSRVYFTAVPSRFSQSPPGECRLVELVDGRRVGGPERKPASECILYLAFDRQCQVVGSARLPGTWMIQRDDAPVP